MSKAAIALFSVLVVVCDTEAAENHSATRNTRVYNAQGFSLRVPRYETQVTEDMAVDFCTYKFRYKEKTVLCVYVGNHPSFGEKIKAFKNAKEEKTKLKGYPMHSVTRKTSTGIVSRDVLLDLSSRSQMWPRFIHFWYKNIPSEMASVGDEMIASTEPKADKEQEKRFQEWEKTLGRQEFEKALKGEE